MTGKRYRIKVAFEAFNVNIDSPFIETHNQRKPKLDEERSNMISYPGFEITIGIGQVFDRLSVAAHEKAMEDPCRRPA